MRLLRHFYGFFFKSWIHSEGGLKASGMRQWWGTLVLGLDHTSSYSGPQEADLFALWLPVGFSQWQAPAGYPKAGEWGWEFSPLAPFLQSLWVWRHLYPKICRSYKQVLSIEHWIQKLFLPLSPSPISSILEVEMGLNVANFVLVSQTLPILWQTFPLINSPRITKFKCVSCQDLDWHPSASYLTLLGFIVCICKTSLVRVSAL